jgi:YVTN family beta-propeller protein
MGWRNSRSSFAVCGALAAIFAGALGAAPLAYVSNDSNDVSVIDTGTNTVVKTIRVGNSPVGVAADVAHNRV